MKPQVGLSIAAYLNWLKTSVIYESLINTHTGLQL